MPLTHYVSRAACCTKPSLGGGFAPRCSVACVFNTFNPEREAEAAAAAERAATELVEVQQRAEAALASAAEDLLYTALVHLTFTLASCKVYA